MELLGHPLGIHLGLSSVQGVLMVLFKNLVWAVMLIEAWCCEEVILVGLIKPSPPSLAGRLISSQTESFGEL